MMTVPGASRVGELTTWRRRRAGRSNACTASVGAAAPGGGAATSGGGRKNGNSGSGAAVAGVENAVAPIASTPKAAAARRVALDELDMIVPLFVAPVRCVVG